jgi:hypothetical protein
MTTCHKAMEIYTGKIQPDLRMMQSIVEHQEVTKKEAALMPVGGLRKQHNDWNLVGGCRQTLKGRIRRVVNSGRD